MLLKLLFGCNFIFLFYWLYFASNIIDIIAEFFNSALLLLFSTICLAKFVIFCVYFLKKLLLFLVYIFYIVLYFIFDLIY
jgi:hypothetical protein